MFQVLSFVAGTVKTCIDSVLTLATGATVVQGVDVSPALEALAEKEGPENWRDIGAAALGVSGGFKHLPLERQREVIEMIAGHCGTERTALLRRLLEAVCRISEQMGALPDELAGALCALAGRAKGVMGRMAERALADTGCGSAGPRVMRQLGSAAKGARRMALLAISRARLDPRAFGEAVEAGMFDADKGVRSAAGGVVDAFAAQAPKEYSRWRAALSPEAQARVPEAGLWKAPARRQPDEHGNFRDEYSLVRGEVMWLRRPHQVE